LGQYDFKCCGKCVNCLGWFEKVDVTEIGGGRHEIHSNYTIYARCGGISFISKTMI